MTPLQRTMSQMNQVVNHIRRLKASLTFTDDGYISVNIPHTGDTLQAISWEVIRTALREIETPNQ